MYLTCLHCLNDKNTELQDCQFYLAKYYPSDPGWYVPGEFNLREKLDEFLAKHFHRDDAPSWDAAMYGDHFTIVSETMLGRAGDEMVSGKRQAMEAIAKAQKEGKSGL
jgi:hypothetical protein